MAPKNQASAALVQLAQDWHRRLGVRDRPGLRLAHGALLLRVLETRGLLPEGQLARAADGAAALSDAFAAARERFGPVFGHVGDLEVPEMLAAYIDALCSPAATRVIRAAPVEALGGAYEQCLGQIGARKTGGVYYTPRAVVDKLVDQTVGALLESSPDLEPASLRVVDPACGAGAFLLGACDRLLAAQLAYLLRRSPGQRRGRVEMVGQSPALTAAERQRVLEACLCGVDLDEHALEVARLCLRLRAHGAAPAAVQLRAGDALAIAWERDFDAVIGNPPWGQKAVEATPERKQHIREAFPSSRGIFDWFRPFVELGVRLTRPGGAWAMVLPDIVLLKNYEPTRRLLLGELAMTEIEWLGMAFPGATIDAVTIAGRKQRAAPDHRVRVQVGKLDHDMRQADFARNSRCAFNLLLTDQKRAYLDRLASFPRLGDFFEVHEGIHSGNIRSELFVDDRVDGSCRELLFGRDELRPYVLRWNGRFVRLSALPETRTRERYANLGQMSWYEQEKILVRRTGDRITAALDPHHRFASNNFFVIIAKRAHPLSMHGLCALLNSSLMTWLFRTVEPRKGRAFAEVKIKHLTAFPIPEAERRTACAALDDLGAERSAAAGQRAGELDARIDAAVHAIFDLEASPAVMMGSA